MCPPHVHTNSHRRSSRELIHPELEKRATEFLVHETLWYHISKTSSNNQPFISTPVSHLTMMTMPISANGPKNIFYSNAAVFPLKLHQMLCGVEEAGNDDIISWLPDGRSFKVHDRERFVRFVMPCYFGSTKLRSFQRNLNLWNFVWSKVKNTKCAVISHPLFIRGCPHLCKQMNYEKLKSSKKCQVLSSGPNQTSLPTKPAETAATPETTVSTAQSSASPQSCKSPARAENAGLEKYIESHYSQADVMMRTSQSVPPVPIGDNFRLLCSSNAAQEAPRNVAISSTLAGASTITSSTTASDELGCLPVVHPLFGLGNASLGASSLYY